MEEHVYPNEPALDREDDEAEALVVRLRAAAKEQELWAPHMPPEVGGSSGSFLVYAHLNEEIGRIWVSSCSAARRRTRGTRRSCGCSERTSRRPLAPAARRRGAAVVLLDDRDRCAGLGSHDAPDESRPRRRGVGDRRPQVVLLGAEGAAFGVVMAVTDPDGDPHRRATQIIVPADTPGVEVVRAIPTMGHRGRGWTTHCEVRYTGVRVPVENTLGEEGDGFRIAQKRLGPGRIHHVMRWLGQMQRAFELMCTYSLERESFGGPLAEKQTVQNWIADSAAEIQACRLMTLDAAHKIDQGDEARVEVSLIKFYAARVLHDVIDRAVQTHGARGLTTRRRSPGCCRWPAARGSTTARTRCTAWSSRGGSSSRSRPASRGDSTSRRRLSSVLGVALVASASRSSERIQPPVEEAVIPVVGPMIAAAGDVACDPEHDSFSGGGGEGRTCRQLVTSGPPRGRRLRGRPRARRHPVRGGRSEGVRGVLRPGLGAREGPNSSGAGQPRVPHPRRRAATSTYFGAAAGDPAQGLLQLRRSATGTSSR